VTDLFACVPVFFGALAPDLEAVGAAFFKGVPVFFFVVREVVDAVELEAFGVVSSYRLPSTGVTSANAQKRAVNASAALVTDLRERVNLIVSL
jgi:hypothetical protein